MDCKNGNQTWKSQLEALDREVVHVSEQDNRCITSTLFALYSFTSFTYTHYALLQSPVYPSVPLDTAG